MPAPLSEPKAEPMNDLPDTPVSMDPPERRTRRCCSPRGSPYEEIAMKRLIPLVLLALTTLSFLSACNTIEGAGRDIEEAGEEIQEEAD